MKNSMIEVCFNFIYPDNEDYNFEYNTTMCLNEILLLNTGDLIDLTELLTKEEFNYFQENLKKKTRRLERKHKPFFRRTY